MRRVFKPQPIPIIVTLLMFAVLLALVAWQLSRSHEKQALLESYAQAPEKAPVHLQELARDWQPFKFRRIELSGKYIDQYQILIENQLNVNRYGYIVLTPLHVSGSGEVVLVNRGWVERKGDQLPDISVPEQQRLVVGLVGSPPGVGIKLGTLDDSAPGWPKRIPYIDIDWLALQMGAPVAPWVILLGANEDEGYGRNWQPSLHMGPEKHKGYAFQWFALAMVLIFLFVAGSLKPEGPDVEDKDKR